MSPKVWDRAKDIFEIAVILPMDQRRSLLEKTCMDDPELLRLVDDLLRGHNRTSGILNIPAAEQSLFTDSSQTDAQPGLRPGEELVGRFRILRLIGSGGMGDVYEAEDLVLDNARVALKTIRTRIVWDPKVEAQFRQEVYLARKVTHPNVCRIHEFFVHENPGASKDTVPRVYFFSMELLPGYSLKTALREQPFSQPQAVAVFTQIAGGLAAAHASGVVHGDLKTANVLLVETGTQLRAVINDFGLATPARSIEAAQPVGSLVGGTPQYMAPELHAGLAPTPRSDVFSLGVVAAELFSGGLSIQRDSIGTWDETAVRGLLQGVPSRVQKVILQCVARRPEDRFQDAGALLTVWLQATAPRKSLYSRRGLVGAVLTGAAGLVVAREFRFGRFSLAKPVLAVLPFRATSHNLEPLADGLADHLITALSHARDVHVIARSSSFLFKGQQVTDLVSFAKQLSADLLLTAELSLEGDSYRVTAHLHQSVDGAQIWRETFLAAIHSTFQLQQQMAAAVFRQLQIAFSRPSRPIPNASAHEAYLKGVYFWNKRDPDNLNRALEHFEMAVRIQPDYAEAWVGVSTTYQLLASSQVPLAEATTRAKEAARKALAIDNQLAEAHLSSALLNHRFDWDWPAALHGFQKAIDLEPGSARAHHWYAGCLSDLGFADRALSEVEIAHSLDPLSFAVDTAAVMYLYAARHFELAIARAKRIIEVEPQYFRVYPFLAASHLEMQDARAAMKYYEQGYELAPTDPYIQAHLAYGGFRCGHTSRAEQAFEELLHRPVPPPPFYVAMVYCGKSDKASAIAWLHRGYTEPDPSMTMMKVHPALDPVRREPEFQDLLQRMRLDSASSVRLM